MSTHTRRSRKGTAMLTVGGLLAGLLFTKYALGDNDDLSPPDLRTGITASSTSNLNCENNALFSTDDSSEPSAATLTLTDPVPGATVTRYVCLRNFGQEDAAVSLAVVGVESLDPACTTGETAQDSTCGGSAAGELHRDIVAELQRIPGDRCDNAITDAAVSVSPAADQTGLAIPGGATQLAEDAGCFKVTVTYPSSTSSAHQTANQSDTLQWRFRFDATNSLPLSGGGEPTYAHGPMQTPPNQSAITLAHWAPGLNTDGFTPQGLTRVPAAASPYGVDTLMVAGYYKDSVPALQCAVYATNEASGAELDVYNVPASTGCDHSDGVAYDASSASLWVASDLTGGARIHRILLSGFASNSAGALDKTLLMPSGDASNYVTRQATGTFSRQGGGASIACPCLILGDYATSGSPFLRRYPLSYLNGAANNSTIAATERSVTVTTPLYVQGAAVDGSGNVWTSSSYWGGTHPSNGRLSNLGSATSGTPSGTHYRFVRGMEGIDFSGTSLWGVSERGSGGLLSSFFPLLFRANLGAMTSSADPP